MIERIKKYVSRWFIFGDLRRPIIPFKVNLLYWKPGNKNNIGDYLSLILFNKIIGGGVKIMCP